MINWARGKKLIGPVMVAVGLVVTGCGAVSLKSPSADVKTFFVAGHEADFLGAQCDAAGYVDLSAYSHLAGVKYPPTFQVDVLNQPPSRPYKPFAVLQYEPSATATGASLESLTSKAREIGADAIIICQPGQNQGLPGLPASSKMQAVAIKYKLTGGSS
jgi:hypothetical protein